MPPAANDLPPPEVPVTPPDWPGDPQIEAREPRNLLLLAAHQIVFRVGWIFKTENVIMPAFLDTVAGAGWLRGCLPVLKGFGQSAPPVFCARWLRNLRLKRRALAAFTLLMSLPFGALSLVWLLTDGRSHNGQRPFWMPGFFLGLYLVFFVFYGLYLLSFGTVQGKLIRPNRRGHLLLVSTFWGTIPAMAFAMWLLPGWLEPPEAISFERIFAFTAVCFLLGSLLPFMVFEPADDVRQPTSQPRGNLADAWRTLRRDRNLRRVVLVAMLFGSGLIIAPHYQALARERLELVGWHLMVWVVVQNAAVGSFSLFVGPLADIWGNRLTLRVLIFGSATAPLFAVVLSRMHDGLGGKLFWLVFIPLGVTPLVQRILNNYTLEICEPGAHPRYLSTVNLCLAVPFVCSPAVGWLVDLVRFELVFLATTGLLVLSGYMTFRLDEPRHRVRHGRAETPGGNVEP